MEAVLDAATTPFAERGPGSVTVRDIAAGARVNHALVHRYLVGAAELAEVLRGEVDAAIERLLQRMVVPADSSS